jgi:cell division protein FtsW
MSWISRNEKSLVASWYYSVDRKLLALLFVLIFVGALSVISAGSIQAYRKHWEWYYFLQKMLPFYIVGIGTLFASSMLNKKWVLFFAALNVVFCALLLFWTVVNPHTINGSDRWAVISGLRLMPSDIIKPGLVILTAWFLSKMKQLYGSNMFLNRESWRLVCFSWWTYLIPFALMLFIMLMHPDIGTTILFLTVVGGMFFVAGLPYKILLPALGGCLGAAGFIFLLFPQTFNHFTSRISDFFAPLDPTSQVGISVRTIRQGGFFGMGDEAFAKESLADAHTDFIFAALVEDWGAIGACAILFIFLLVWRHLIQTALSVRDRFVFYAVFGAGLLFIMQTCINLATTLGMIPPKGMTLPFISYGGSSFMGYCLLFGMIMALVREDKWNK